MTISNMYETDEYANFAQLMYDWAQAGFISKDAATSTEDRNTVLQGGNYLGYFAWSTPGSEEATEAAVGMDLTVIPVLDGYTAGDRFQNILWSVPITSANPAKAVEALNYIYAHDEAAWLLQYGIEGQDYEVIEKTDAGTKINRHPAHSSDLSVFPEILCQRYYAGRRKRVIYIRKITYEI